MNSDVLVGVKLQRLALCASLAAPVAACSSGSSTVEVVEVVVHNYVFPAVATTPGATLKLVDQDDEPHTVTADGGAFKVGPFNSKAPGLLVAPTKPGSYAFHCEIHPTMHGTLVVHTP